MSAAGARLDRLREQLFADAKRLGFEVAGIAAPDALGDASEKLNQWIGMDYHASMGWMETTRDRRGDPQILWPDVGSIVMLAMNYGPNTDPLQLLADRSAASISVYARHRDYHDVIKGKLKEIAQRHVARSGDAVKVFVDTAPVMEKPLAALAGVGWQGKHTNLVSREFGSWLFLASIFTTTQFSPGEAETDHCGSCTACIDICPTKAFPAPYQLDARRCISYLTIEHHGLIPLEFRAAMANRIYGCDDCLAVCPWNKFASATSEMKLAARDDLQHPRLALFLAMDDAAFRAFFTGSPVKRIGRTRFVRNCLIAAGNSNDPALLPLAERLIHDPDPVVRATAVWAVSRLTDSCSSVILAAMAAETDETVLLEWRQARTRQQERA